MKKFSFVIALTMIILLTGCGSNEKLTEDLGMTFEEFKKSYEKILVTEFDGAFKTKLSLNENQRFKYNNDDIFSFEDDKILLALIVNEKSKKIEGISINTILEDIKSDEEFEKIRRRQVALFVLVASVFYNDSDFHLKTVNKLLKNLNTESNKIERNKLVYSAWSDKNMVFLNITPKNLKNPFNR